MIVIKKRITRLKQIVEKLKSQKKRKTTRFFSSNSNDLKYDSTTIVSRTSKKTIIIKIVKLVKIFRNFSNKRKKMNDDFDFQNNQNIHAINRVSSKINNNEIDHNNNNVVDYNNAIIRASQKINKNDNIFNSNLDFNFNFDLNSNFDLDFNLKKHFFAFDIANNFNQKLNNSNRSIVIYVKISIIKIFSNESNLEFFVKYSISKTFDFHDDSFCIFKKKRTIIIQSKKTRIISTRKIIKTKNFKNLTT